MRSILLLGSAALAACGPVSTETDAGAHVHDDITELRFAAKVGTAPFACNQTYSLGTPATQYSPRDLRFYVSEIALIDDEGNRVPFVPAADGTWQSEQVAMLDFEDATSACSNGTAATHTTITGRAAGAHFRRVEFTLGVPFALNHQDATAALAPLNSSALFWSWQAGYKFLRADGVTTGLPNGHNVHVGSTGCTPGPNQVESCANPNRAIIALDGFNPDTSTIVFDLKALLDGSNLDTNLANTAPGCMSTPTDLDCAPMFERLGLPFGATPAGLQRVFTLSN